MNAEQLHAISIELQEIINESQTKHLLSKLKSALQQLVSQPSQHQELVAQTRSDLVENLSTSTYNEWTLNRLQIAKEIGSTEIFGFALASRIEQSFETNAATPEVIRTDIEQMETEVSEFDAALTQLIQSFEAFEIGFEELEAGEGEIGVIIPRATTDNLSDFTTDLKKINWELKTLADALTGTPENFQIRTISSSDFSVFLDAIPELVEKVSSVFKLLKKAYDAYTELKQLRNKTAETGQASDELLHAYDATIERAMTDQITQIMAEIRPMYQARLDAGEIQGDFEVRVESAIKSMASRCDRGYAFTFRIGSPVVEVEDEPTEEEEAQIQLAASVAANNEELQKLHSVEPGQPILPLEWSNSPASNDEE